MHLHIMLDSIYTKKFIERINTSYNQNEHLFIIFSKGKLQYVNENRYLNLRIIFYKDPIDVLFNPKIIVKIKQYMIKSEKLYIHFLSSIASYYLLLFGRYSKKIYWMTWGADIYQAIKDYPLYEEDTKKIFKKINQKNIFSNIKDFLNRSLKKLAIKKINYICSPFSGDYHIIIKNWNTKAEWKNFAYISPTDINGKNELQNCIEKNKKEIYTILLGNSANPTNNHISIIYQLSRFKRKDFIVYCPLSYGEKDYAEIICKLGREYLGDRFKPLTDFLPPEQYIKLLETIDVGIFNHYRQQAGATIGSLILLKKIIYMRDTSLYKFYQENNINIKLIDEMNEDNLFCNYMADIDVKRARNLDKNFISKEVYDSLFQ